MRKTNYIFLQNRRAAAAPRQQLAPVTQRRPLVQVTQGAAAGAASSRRPIVQVTEAAASRRQLVPVTQATAAAASSRRPIVQVTEAAAGAASSRRQLVPVTQATAAAAGAAAAAAAASRRPIVQVTQAAAPAAGASRRPIVQVTQVAAAGAAASQLQPQPAAGARGTEATPPSPPPPFSSNDEEDEDEESSFESLFKSFSNQWLHTHLTHHVSLAATSDFWKLSFKYISNLLELKQRDNVKKKIPQFLQIRKNTYNHLCPDVHMTFAFLDKTDNSIIKVNVDRTPVKEFERNPRYQKLYEEAHIKVPNFHIS